MGNEIQSLSFKIPELFERFPGELSIGEDNGYRPVIIITSNNERPLPKAFLRRCVYYHMQEPPYRGEKYSIESIVINRLGARFDKHLKSGERQRLLDEAIGLYQRLRESDLEKPPNMAELLAWVYYLSRQRNEAGGMPGKDQAKGKDVIENWAKSKS